MRHDGGRRAQVGLHYPLTDGAHDIAPLEGYPVLHDLIVDKTQRHLATSARYNRVRFDDMNRDEINQFDMGAQEKVYSIEWCTRCGRCARRCRPTPIT